MRRALIFTLALAATAPAYAQSVASGQSGRRSLLPRVREVALARSAAPSSLADSATVYVLTDSGYVVAVRGTSGAACYVSRDWLASLEPHCFDAEGAATILPMAMRRIELLHQGRTPAEADRVISDGLADGTYRLPRRPAVSYMMSSAQQLIDDEGRSAGRWQPHLMIFYPYLTAADIGLAGGSDPRAAVLVDEGKPTANIMVIVREFVDPSP